MRYLKLTAVLAAVALLAAGVAQASGALSGGHEDASYDAAQAKVERVEEKFAKADGPAAVAARPRGQRGPRGPRGPRGAKGAAGPIGPSGPSGPKGTFGSVKSVDGPSVFLCSFEAGSCAVGSAVADCPPGTTLTGGGYKGAGIVTTVTWSAPVANGWGVIAVNLDEVPVTALRPVAECASS
jgi:hypothetical protein